MYSYFDEFEEANSKASSFSEVGNDDAEIIPMSNLHLNIDENHEKEIYLRMAKDPKAIKVYTRKNK